MTIFTSWKNSLTICSLKNSKLLWYAFMRSVRDLYILLWRNAPILVLSAFILYILERIHFVYRAQQAVFDARVGTYLLAHQSPPIATIQIFSFLLQAVLLFYLFFYTFLLARNSMQNKDVFYLKEWKKKYMGLFFGAITCTFFLILLCTIPFLSLFLAYPRLQIGLPIYAFLVTVFFKAFYFIGIFFVLDTAFYYSSMAGNKLYRMLLLVVNAWKNSFKMVVYNMPLFFLIGFLTNVLWTGFDFFISFISEPSLFVSLKELLYVVFFPFTVCLYGVLYTKYSYEQIDLYTEGVKE